MRRRVNDGGANRDPTLHQCRQLSRGGERNAAKRSSLQRHLARRIDTV